MTDVSNAENALRGVVRDYLEGMVFARSDQLRRAFHPKASVVGHWEGSLEWSSLDDFVAACEAAGSAPANEPFYWEILSTDVVGDIATVKLADDYFGVRFMDYLTLLNEGGRWQIVNKTFYAKV